MVLIIGVMPGLYSVPVDTPKSCNVSLHEAANHGHTNCKTHYHVGFPGQLEMRIIGWGVFLCYVAVDIIAVHPNTQTQIKPDSEPVMDHSPVSRVLFQVPLLLMIGPASPHLTKA